MNGGKATTPKGFSLNPKFQSRQGGIKSFTLLNDVSNQRLAKKRRIKKESEPIMN